MMLRAEVIAVVIAAVVISFIEAADQELILRPTYRSFMAAGCVATNPNADKRCIYVDAIWAGKVGGHPDFQKSPVFGLNLGITAGYAARDVSGLYKPVYCKGEHEGGVCGNPGSGQTTGWKNFQTWYRDDAFYNKRLAKDLVLTQRSCDGDTCTYMYDSAENPGVGNNFFGPLDEFIPESNQYNYPANYEDSRIWPQMDWETNAWHNNKQSEGEGQHKYTFSTEIHTYFTYQGTEVLSFSGDDDLFIMVDSKLVLDLGGVHSVRSATVKLADKAEELGLVVGNIYSLDIFNTERNTEMSNCKLTTTLTASCNVMQSSSVAFDLKTASESDIYFRPRAGSYLTDSKYLVLTDPSTSQPYFSSYAFLYQQQNAGTGFKVSFKYAEEGSNEGFAFVLHRRPDGLVNLPSSTGGNLGFAYYENSVAIPFDLCSDRLDPGTLSCSQKRVSVNYRNSTSDSIYNGPDARSVYENLALFKNDKIHTVEIIYYVRPNWLEVYVDNSLYLQQSDFNLTEVIGGRNAFFGFTTSTGSNPGTITISDFTVETVSVEQNETVLVDRTYPDEGIADGVTGLPALQIQTRDFCKNNVEYGGYGADFKGLFVEKLNEYGTYNNGSLTPLIVDAASVDNEDGTYTMELITRTSTEFELYSCFGECWFQYELVPYTSETNGRILADDGVMVAKVTLTTNSSSDAFYDHKADGIVTVPKTRQPTASPTTPTVAPTPEKNDSIKNAAIGSSVALFFLICLIILLCCFRKKWKKDKNYIEEGRVHRMEQDLHFYNDDEYSQVGNELLETRAAILKERSGKPQTMREVEINDLIREKEELQEQIRINKKKKQLDEAHNSTSLHESVRPSRFGAFSKRFSKKRKEFRDPEFQVCAPQI